MLSYETLSYRVTEFLCFNRTNNTYIVHFQRVLIIELVF